MNKIMSSSLIIDVSIIRVYQATADPSVDEKVINIGLPTETLKRNKLKNEVQVVKLLHGQVL